MATELRDTSSAIRKAQSYLLEIDKSAKSLYMLLDKFQVREERGQLSANVVEDLSAVLQEELLKAGKRITRARDIIVCSVFTGENPLIGCTKPSKDSRER